MTSNALGAGATAAALTIGVPAARLLSTPRSRQRLGTRLSGAFSAVNALFSFPRGLKLSSVLYAVLTPTLFGAGLAYLFRPSPTLSNILGYTLTGRDSVFIWRNLGAFLCTVFPAITYSLKEKADADALDDASSRTLNVGLAMTSAAHLGVLGSMVMDGTGGGYANAVAGMWAAVGVAAVVGLAASATTPEKF